MICKHCGTESADKFCPHCGRPLIELSGATPPLREKPAEPEKKEAQPQPEEKRAEEKRSRKKPYRLRFSHIFFPVLTFFLPLVYFFTDVYARLAPQLFATDAAGNTLISVLVDRLSSAEFGMNTLKELQVITLGTSAPLYEAVSFAGRGSAGELLVPLYVVLGFSVAAALLGALLLVSGGRILRSSFWADLAIFAGVGATFSPLAGLLYLRFYHFFTGGFAAADAAMHVYSLSVDSILMIGILLFTLLPSVAALRREAASLRNSKAYVLAPYRRMGGRSFVLTRMLTAVAIGICAFLGLLQMFLPILPLGHLFQLGTAWDAVAANFSNFTASLGALITAKAAEADFAALTAITMELVFVFLGPLILFSLIFVIFSLLSVLFSRRRNLCDKRGKCRSLQKVGRRLRRLYLIPFWCYTAVQIFLVMVLLFCTKIVFHVDLGAVSTTMTLVYLLMGHVKALCGTNTLFALIATGGALLWHTAQNLALRLIDLSCHSNGLD